MGFKDDQILIIAPGSHTTLAQHGLPESFTPARLRLKSRMFQAEQEGEWEPVKIRKKPTRGREDGLVNEVKQETEQSDKTAVYEEDHETDDGAVWPIVDGRIQNWSCFFALINHVHNTINPSIHTPVLLISQPAWTAREVERITQFFFEKFKIPALGIMDSAMATCYAYGVPTATVVDVGLTKADITAVSDYLVQDTGRGIAVPDCGGEAMTQTFLQLLKPRNFTRDMCEQLKKSPICEILPPGTPLPGSTETMETVVNPAAAASTGAEGPGPDSRSTAGARGEAPRGPGKDTEVGEEPANEKEGEGILDVASIVAGGKTNEFLAQREKQKAEKAAARKKGSVAAQAPVKLARLANPQRERNTFTYEAWMERTTEPERVPETADADTKPAQPLSDSTRQDEAPNGSNGMGKADEPRIGGNVRREVEVGTERLKAASGGLLERIADAVYRTVSSVEDIGRRSELWDSLIIVGNGSKVRGFHDALVATINSKYLISPSSATIFTSELPSNLSTPAATGANTPQPGQYSSHPQPSSHVNPLLLAATTAQNPNLLHPASSLMQQQQYGQHHHHSSHGQTPTMIKLAKIPDYFPEWKDRGMEEAQFLGAQIAAKVLFVVDGGQSKGFMSRVDYNEQGPAGIHDYSL